MSNKKLFGFLSGAQITLIVCTAIITPGVVYAVSTTPVAITDPGTGKQAFVDIGRRLYTFDPIAGYANNPANIVNASGTGVANGVANVYKVPTGKALIVKAISARYQDGTGGFANDADFYQYSNSAYIYNFYDANAIGAHSAELGSGVVVSSGDTIELYSTMTIDYTLQGYLVPSTAVPAANTIEAAEQLVNNGNPGKKR